MMESIEIALHYERPISPQALRSLYDAIHWWPARGLRQIAFILRRDVAIGAWHEAQLIGFARVVDNGRSRATVEDVLVHPDFQHRGIGFCLMQTLLTQLTHIDTISLTCEPDLVSFYQSLGFQPNKKASKMRLRHGRSG